MAAGDTRLHTLAVLVENSAGVLSQVSRLFSRRGYNIESLAVGATHRPEVSRMTICVNGTDRMIEQIKNQLKKLTPVISVRELDSGMALLRELTLVKVSASQRETRDEIIQIVNVFRSKIIDISKSSITVEVTANEEKTRALLELLSEFGIIEMVRTGVVALERGSAAITDKTKDGDEFGQGKNVQAAESHVL